MKLKAIIILSVAVLMMTACMGDMDGDTIPDALDNCPTVMNTDQADSNNNGVGDACEVTPLPNEGDTSFSNCDGVDNFKSEMLRLVNEARAQGRYCGDTYYPAVGSVTWNNTLGQASLNHSNDMMQNNFFNHEGSDGSRIGQRLNDVNYSYSYANENIAVGYKGLPEAMDALVKSPGHCKNIMNNRVTEVGAACVKGGDNNDWDKYWTQVFGKQF